MTIIARVKIRPFSTPNFAIQEATPGFMPGSSKEPSKFALHELDTDTLEALCDQFRKDIFAKAEKRGAEANG
jgi:hypothetical protein